MYVLAASIQYCARGALRKEKSIQNKREKVKLSICRCVILYIEYTKESKVKHI